MTSLFRIFITQKGLPHLFSEPAPLDYDISQFVDLFMRGKVWPGDIREHSASYSKQADSIEYTPIRYEALLAEPQQEYHRLLGAAGINFPGEQLNDLIEHTSFANMRRLRSPEAARAGLVESNPVYIMRSGVAGQHAQVLNDSDKQRIESVFGHEFNRT